jgi:ureidoglycolate hydrolase
MPVHVVPMRSLTPDAFAPFGEVLAPQEDGTPLSPAEAALDLSQGPARFYVMQLRGSRDTFTRITRHRAVTQCLASVGGHPWRVAVAEPSAGDGTAPALDDIVGFEIPGDVAILLRRSTWHAGPYYDGDAMAFFNLELADTNVVDHDTCRLDERWGVECAFDAGPAPRT